VTQDTGGSWEVFLEASGIDGSTEGLDALAAFVNCAVERPGEMGHTLKRRRCHIVEKSRRPMRCQGIAYQVMVNG
jgi:hypothetical protein